MQTSHHRIGLRNMKDNCHSTIEIVGKTMSVFGSEIKDKIYAIPIKLSVT